MKWTTEWNQMNWLTIKPHNLNISTHTIHQIHFIIQYSCSSSMQLKFQNPKWISCFEKYWWIKTLIFQLESSSSTHRKCSLCSFHLDRNASPKIYLCMYMYSYNKCLFVSHSKQNKSENAWNKRINCDAIHHTPYTLHTPQLSSTKINWECGQNFQYASKQQNVFPLFCVMLLLAFDVDVAVRLVFVGCVYNSTWIQDAPKLRKLFDSIQNSNAENKWKFKHLNLVHGILVACETGRLVSGVLDVEMQCHF